MRTVAFVYAVFSIPTIAGCSGAQGGEKTSSTSSALEVASSEPSDAPRIVASTSVRVPKRGTKLVHVQTVPRADCDISDSSDATGVQARVWADGKGVIEFAYQGAPQPEAHVGLKVSCQEAGATVVHPVDLEVIDGDVPPEPPAQQEGVILPALADPDSVSDEEVIARGYLPRPSKDAASAYAAWRRAVSKPVLVVDPQPVKVSGTSHGMSSNSGGSSVNWSGVVAIDPFTYDTAQSLFFIPTYAGQISGFDRSAFWAGLGGNSVNDTEIVQAGSESDALPVKGVVFLIYYVWVEYYPNDMVELSMPVGGGDELIVAAWGGDQLCNNQKPFGGYGCFEIQDLTRNTVATMRIARPSNAAPFSGTSAEWIMEKPLTSNGLLPLYDYGTAAMYAAFALDSRGWLSYGQQSNVIWKIMYGSDGAESFPYAIDGNRADIGWSWINF